MPVTKEIWKPVELPGGAHPVKYMISNHGRLAVKQADGSLDIRRFKPTGGIYRYNVRVKGKSTSIFLTREVARAFLRKPSPRHTFIIHKDHNYLNDRAENLRWATLQEHREHTSQSPRSIEARDRRAIVRSSHSRVLDEKTVKAMKKLIWDPNRTVSFSQIARRFGVSEMQIYRIKNGVFWYHIRVPNEPAHPRYKKNLQNIRFQQKKSQKLATDRRRRLAEKSSATNSNGTTEKAVKVKRKKEIRSQKSNSRRDAAAKIAFRRKPVKRAAKSSSKKTQDFASRITADRKPNARANKR